MYFYLFFELRIHYSVDTDGQCGGCRFFFSSTQTIRQFHTISPSGEVYISAYPVGRECSQQPAVQIFTHNYRAPGLPWWLSGKESACQCRRCRFDPWAGKIPWRRKWQPTSVFLPGKSHGQRSLVACSPWGGKRVGDNLVTKQ